MCLGDQVIPQNNPKSLVREVEDKINHSEKGEFPVGEDKAPLTGVLYPL